MSHFDKFIGHRRHYTRKSLHQALTKGGFLEINVQRSGFPAINLLRIFTIISGRHLTKLIKNSNFGDLGVSGHLVHLLRFLFKYTIDDHFMGWQLISQSKKVQIVV
jgi:hypothetical protein